MQITLTELGWNNELTEAFQVYQGQYVPARVAAEYKGMYKLYTESGTCLGEISGKMHHLAESRQDYPAVGDWVVVSYRPAENRATIEHILPRKSVFARKVAGRETTEQVVAANVDWVFLVTSLNQDFNARRLERYLVLCWESGAKPVVVLSKADLCQDIEERIAEVEGIAFGVPIIPVSVISGQGIDELEEYLSTGETVALMGSSGVGKSSLVNFLLKKEQQVTKTIREDDDRGRHATTHRELFLLAGGGLVLDTPGMRELGLWDGDSGLDTAFRDIEELALGCRFRDCSHEQEPDCAVRQALEEGQLSADRWESYQKLQKELAYLARKDQVREMLAHKNKWKKISKDAAHKKRML